MSGFVSIVVGESRVPALEQRPEGAVEGTRPGLQQQVDAAFGPSHLLTLDEAIAETAYVGRAPQPLSGHAVLCYSEGVLLLQADQPCKGMPENAIAYDGPVSMIGTPCQIADAIQTAIRRAGKRSN